MHWWYILYSYDDIIIIEEVIKPDIVNHCLTIIDVISDDIATGIIILSIHWNVMMR